MHSKVWGEITWTNIGIDLCRHMASLGYINLNTTPPFDFYIWN